MTSVNPAALSVAVIGGRFSGFRLVLFLPHQAYGECIQTRQIAEVSDAFRL
jgi:hypothetical protein